MTLIVKELLAKLIPEFTLISPPVKLYAVLEFPAISEISDKLPCVTPWLLFPLSSLVFPLNG